MGWFNKTKAPPPVTLPYFIEAHQNSRFNPFAGHSFSQARLPDPGAAGWVYDLWGLVEFSPIGYGTANRAQFQTMSPPVSVALHGVVTNGLGGLTAGQVIQSPLTLANYRPSQGING